MSLFLCAMCLYILDVCPPDVVFLLHIFETLDILQISRRDICVMSVFLCAMCIYILDVWTPYPTDFIFPLHVFETFHILQISR